MFSGYLVMVLFGFLWTDIHSADVLVADCFLHACPDYKPFCTPIGCVIKCPTNDFINGSTCVKSCDHMFVGEESRCQADCPMDHVIEEETVRDGDIYRIDKYCVKTCDSGLFIFNQTCTPVCPQQAKYADDVNCVAECPPGVEIVGQGWTLADRIFYWDRWIINDNDRHLRCRKDCTYGFFQDGVCVSRCNSSNRYSFNETCREKCPEDANLIFRSSGTTVCTAECIYGMANQNGTCAICQGNVKYVFNVSCVSTCPQDKPYINNVRVAYKRMVESAEVCTDKCPDEKKLNGQNCVYRCPVNTTVFDKQCLGYCPENKFVYKDSCVSRCPHSNPFIKMVQSDTYSIAVCVNICPDGFVMLGTLCVYECRDNTTVLNQFCKVVCPENKMVYNGSCVSRCPQDQPFYRDVISDGYSTGICVNKCPDGWFISGEKCVPKCLDTMFVVGQMCTVSCPDRLPVAVERINTYWPHRKYFNCESECPNVDICSCSPGRPVLYNGICVSTCPPQANFTRQTTFARVCTYTCFSDEHIYNNSCVTSCPSSSNKVYNYTCVDSCPTKYTKLDQDTGKYNCAEECDGFIYNQTICVDKCPINQTYMYNRTCLESCPTKLVDYRTCVDECPSSKYILNNKECVFSCPSDQQYEYNNTCLKSCPTRYFHSRICVDVCPVSKYIFNDTECVTSCRDNYPYSYNNKCVEFCPTKYVDQIYKICYNECPDHRYISYDRECSSFCEKYIFNRTCVKFCPTRYVDYKTCVDECPTGKYVFGHSCVSSCPSTHNYIHNLTCLNKICSTRYEYIHHSTSNIMCVDNCPNGTYINNTNTCVDKCTHFHFQSSCVNICPTTALLIRITGKKECVTSCSAYMFNGTCVDACPSDKPFIHEQVCYDDCPPGTIKPKANPFQPFKQCLNKCPNDEVKRNNTCITISDCEWHNSGFVFKDECLNECPEIYVLIGVCVDMKFFYIPMIVICTVLLLIIIMKIEPIRDWYKMLRHYYIYRKVKSFDDLVVELDKERPESTKTRLTLNEDDEDKLEDIVLQNDSACLVMAGVYHNSIVSCDDESIPQLGVAGVRNDVEQNIHELDSASVTIAGVHDHRIVLCDETHI